VASSEARTAQLSAPPLLPAKTELRLPNARARPRRHDRHAQLQACRNPAPSRPRRPTKNALRNAHLSVSRRSLPIAGQPWRCRVRRRTRRRPSAAPDLPRGDRPSHAPKTGRSGSGDDHRHWRLIAEDPRRRVNGSQLKLIEAFDMSHHAARFTHKARVERSRCTPNPARICTWRYSGRDQANFDATT
jgi:hypothetical protein